MQIIIYPGDDTTSDKPFLKKVLAEAERNGLSDLCKICDVIIMGVRHGFEGK